SRHAPIVRTLPLRRPYPRIQLSEPLGCADIAPFAQVQLAANAASRNRSIEQRRQGKLPGSTPLEQLRPIHPNSRVGVSPGIPLHDLLPLQSEIAAWMLSWIGDEHEPR